MPTTTTAATATIPALDALRSPVRAYTPPDDAGVTFKAGMLHLADDLEDLWTTEDDEPLAEEPRAGEGLESDVVAIALYAFPGLITPGPPPGEIVELALGGHLADAGSADTLQTLCTIRGLVQAFEPPGVTAALWRSALLAIFRLIEVFTVLGDQRSVEQCYDLFNTAEAMADRFAGKA